MITGQVSATDRPLLPSLSPNPAQTGSLGHQRPFCPWQSGAAQTLHVAIVVTTDLILLALARRLFLSILPLLMP